MIIIPINFYLRKLPTPPSPTPIINDQSIIDNVEYTYFPGSGLFHIDKNQPSTGLYSYYPGFGLFEINNTIYDNTSYTYFENEYGLYENDQTIQDDSEYTYFENEYGLYANDQTIQDDSDYTFFGIGDGIGGLLYNNDDLQDGDWIYSEGLDIGIYSNDDSLIVSSESSSVILYDNQDSAGVSERFEDLTVSAGYGYETFYDNESEEGIFSAYGYVDDTTTASIRDHEENKLFIMDYNYGYSDNYFDTGERFPEYFSIFF